MFKSFLYRVLKLRYGVLYPGVLPPISSLYSILEHFGAFKMPLRYFETNQCSHAPCICPARPPGDTVAALVRVPSEGAAAALQSGDGRVVGAFNASYALQSLALLRPALAQTSGLCDGLLASLGRAMVGEVTLPAICLGNCKLQDSADSRCNF